LINGNQRKTIATGFDLPMGMTMRPNRAAYVSDRGCEYFVALTVAFSHSPREAAGSCQITAG
jgi:hypothetical protein